MGEAKRMRLHGRERKDAIYLTCEGKHFSYKFS